MKREIPMSQISRRLSAVSALAVMAVSLGACAALQNVIQPPIFHMAEGRTSEFRILGPAGDRPLGGAQVRIWTRVQNPNTVGFTLTRLAGQFLLEGDHAANIDLPLGLPLPAASDTVIPIDLNISFADVPGLANQFMAALGGQRLNYAVDGIMTVDAGVLGQPSFGPSTWMRGELQVIR
jgi:hypothetical protein